MSLTRKRRFYFAKGERCSILPMRQPWQESRLFRERRSRTFGTAPGLITARVITIKLISLVISSRYSRPAGTRILDYYKLRDYRPEGASVPLLAIGAITNAFTSVNEPHCIPIFSPLPRFILLISSFFLSLSFYFSLSLFFLSCVPPLQCHRLLSRCQSVLLDHFGTRLRCLEK